MNTLYQICYYESFAMSFFGISNTPESLLEQRAKLYGEVSKLYEKIAQIDTRLKEMKKEGAKITIPKNIKPGSSSSPTALEIREFSSVKQTKNTSAGVSAPSKKAWTVAKMKEFCVEKKLDYPTNGKRDVYVEIIRSANKVREMDKFMF